MKLQTIVDITPLKERIDYQSRIFTIGSCFAQRVGDEMRRAKLRVDVNPMGVLFNPVSIAQTISRLNDRRLIGQSDLRQGVGAEPAWYNFDFHSSLTTDKLDESVESINEAIERAADALQAANWVVITLGTAWVYELKESGEVVANCHKRPRAEFNRRRLSVGEVVAAMESLLNGALQGKQVILTVSPIRHIGDGLAENSVSKATLRLAVEQLCESYQNVSYFPSYEIVIDELRDYRFYDRDMVHIAPVAVEYIWERFVQNVLSDEAQRLLPQVMQVVRATEHRAQNPRSESHRKFVEAQLRSIERLKGVEFGEEIAKFEDILKLNL